MSREVRIYVLVRAESCEGDEIRGVYSSRDRAEGAREEMFKKDELSDPEKRHWCIREFVLNRRAIGIAEL